jgi:hypothetical protein
MKISPVPTAGIPTIQSPSIGGVSFDKLERAKAVAAGQKTAEPTQEEKEKLVAAVQSQPTIKMNVNKTPISEVEVPSETAAPKPESFKSDDGVQATEASEVTQPISPQLAALARQRRALQVKERELAEKEKAMSGPAKSLDEYKARLKSNALSVLLEEGVTYEQLTNEILASQGQINPEVEKLKAEIAELKTGVDKRFSESQVAQETQAINYLADKLDALTVTGDDFELLKAADGEEEVIRRVYSHWKRTGKELDVAQVAKEYQEELADEAARYAKLKMVQGKLTPTEPAPVTPTKSQQGIRTLTNKDSARPSMDRRQRAILAMRGQLQR